MKSYDRIREIRRVYDDALDMCDSRSSAVNVTLESIESMFTRYNTSLRNNMLEIWGEHAKYLVTDIDAPSAISLGHHKWKLIVIAENWSIEELNYLEKLGPRKAFNY